MTTLLKSQLHLEPANKNNLIGDDTCKFRSCTHFISLFYFNFYIATALPTFEKITSKKLPQANEGAFEDS